MSIANDETNIASAGTPPSKGIGGTDLFALLVCSLI